MLLSTFFSKMSNLYYPFKVKGYVPCPYKTLSLVLVSTFNFNLLENLFYLQPNFVDKNSSNNTNGEDKF